MFCYKNSKLIMTAARYKGGKLIITSLIIIKIRFVCFSKDKVGGSHIRSYIRSYCRSNCRLHAKSYDYRSYDMVLYKNIRERRKCIFTKLLR